jgi:DNA-binding CsgD family transcriptional regulator
MDELTSRGRPTPLTGREQIVLALIADGLSNDAIAGRLFLSRHTVAWHIGQIFDKLAVKRRTQAVAVARALGLVGDEQRTAARAKHNLPYPTTPFVGRKAELDELYNLLASPGVRLLTILARRHGKTCLPWGRQAAA